MNFPAFRYTLELDQYLKMINLKINQKIFKAHKQLNMIFIKKLSQLQLDSLNISPKKLMKL